MLGRGEGVGRGRLESLPKEDEMIPQQTATTLTTLLLAPALEEHLLCARKTRERARAKARARERVRVRSKEKVSKEEEEEEEVIPAPSFGFSNTPLFAKVRRKSQLSEG